MREDLDERLTFSVASARRLLVGIVDSDLNVVIVMLTTKSRDERTFMLEKVTSLPPVPQSVSGRTLSTPSVQDSARGTSVRRSRQECMFGLLKFRAFLAGMNS